MASVIPASYQEWKHCITVECGLDLTEAFIQQRVEALMNNKDEHTRQFVSLYGDQYRQQVLAWFQQAQKEPLSKSP